MAMRIGTVVNLPITQLVELSAKLDPNLPVVAVCNSAYRSSLAAGILQRKGFKNVASLAAPAPTPPTRTPTKRTSAGC
jgi:rhodanese-related sulfurtransferase